MSKYTNEEQEFLDKAAIAAMTGLISNVKYFSCDKSMIQENLIFERAFKQAKALLTERKKLFGDE